MKTLIVKQIDLCNPFSGNLGDLIAFRSNLANYLRTSPTSIVFELPWKEIRDWNPDDQIESQAAALLTKVRTLPGTELLPKRYDYCTSNFRAGLLLCALAIQVHPALEQLRDEGHLSFSACNCGDLLKITLAWPVAEATRFSWTEAA